MTETEFASPPSVSSSLPAPPSSPHPYFGALTATGRMRVQYWNPPPAIGDLEEVAVGTWEDATEPVVVVHTRLKPYKLSGRGPSQQQLLMSLGLVSLSQRSRESWALDVCGDQSDWSQTEHELTRRARDTSTPWEADDLIVDGGRIEVITLHSDVERLLVSLDPRYALIVNDRRSDRTADLTLIDARTTSAP